MYCRRRERQGITWKGIVVTGGGKHLVWKRGRREGGEESGTEENRERREGREERGEECQETRGKRGARSHRRSQHDQRCWRRGQGAAGELGGRITRKQTSVKGKKEPNYRG